MKYCLFFFIILTGCNTNERGTDRSLDSLLKSEDSSRMINAIADPFADKEDISVTNDPDIDFARLMHEYYKAELNGAEIELKRGSDSTVIAIAKDQLRHHQADVELFDDYAYNQQPSRIDSSFVPQFYRSLKETTPVAALSKVNFDGEFLQLVITHHEKAIALSELYLKYTKDPFLKIKAINIVKAHQVEVQKLKTLLRSL